jgi:uncharacterized membrane protein YozB (DUF420 family)
LIEAENITVESMVSIASTPIGASVNLVIQFALLLLLIAGGGFARMGRLKTHRRVMIIAIVVQAGTLIFWMAPSLVLNIGAFGAFGTGQLITILHMTVATLRFSSRSALPFIRRSFPARILTAHSADLL